jgi:hypothetical protein
MEYASPISNPIAVKNQPRDKTVGGLLVVCLLAIFGYLLITVNIRVSHGHSGDFRHFYFAAEAMLRHRDLYSSGTKGYLYPPLIAFLYTPVVPLSFTAAQRVMLVVNMLLTLSGILMVSRDFIERFDAPKSAVMLFGAAFLGALINVDKIRTELQMFQTNALMFFMFAVSLRLLDRRRVMAGIPLGVIFNIKYLSLGMLPWLIIRRRWSTAVSCVLSTIFFAMLPAVISGWHTNLGDLRTSYGGLLHMVGINSADTEHANVEDIRDLLSCSITSAMARTPLNRGSLPVGLMYAGVIAIAALATVVWLYWRNHLPIFAWPIAKLQTRQPWKAVIGLEFTAIVMVTLCFSPQTNTRHLLLVLLLSIPAAVLILAPHPEAGRGSLIIVMCIVFAGFIFPFGDRAPHVSMLWFGVGGQCWCLLLGLLTLVSVGLRKNKTIPGRAGPDPG